jgi:peptidoglycan hydrolase-like protein with peptidoglycan-binding domain
LTPKCVIESEKSLSSENIAFLQIKLKNKGFNPGAIDGNYGGSSKKALNAYEKKNKLQLSTGSNINNASMKLLGVNC